MCLRFCLLLLAGCLVLGSGPSPAAESDPDEQVLSSAKVATDGPTLLQFLRQRTLSNADRDKLASLIKKLGDDDFSAREQASTDLVNMGVLPVALLRQAVSNPDVEIARRAESCLDRIEKKHQIPGPGISGAVARLIAKRKPAGAVEVLLAYLPFADDEAVIDDVRSALPAVALVDGKPSPVLMEALKDKSGLKRGAAGEALIRAAKGEAPEEARKLLADPVPAVRLWAALAQAEARGKDAIPVLVALLTELPREQGWQAEELLFRLAGDQAPKVTLGDSPAERQKCRDAWAAWWKDNEAKVDLAKLTATERMLGYTLVVSTNNQGGGTVQELGPDKKPRWEIPGLQFVIDAQVLPGNRVLVAEYNGSMVTERDLKGQVVWRHNLPNPFHCQRLPNGNTFMVCRNQMIEVDRAGKAVRTHNRPGHDLMAAQRLRDGHIIYITQDGNLHRMDPAGKVVKTFSVGQVQTFVRIDVLPNGRVIVPQYGTSKVIEYDSDGKAVWQANVQNPTSAMRLPNGNTLVGSLSGSRVIELDRNSKEVWTHQAGGQVWCAWRR